MDGEPQQKAHRARQSGRKAVKKNVRFKQRNDAKHDKSNDDADGSWLLIIFMILDYCRRYFIEAHKH
jgi:hypothetical protein